MKVISIIRLGIHTSKKVDKQICEQEPFKSVLAMHGYTASNLPVGVMLGIVNLNECSKVLERGTRTAMLESGAVVTGNEFKFGYYNRGRFVWGMRDVNPFPNPIPAKGQLGLWNYQGGER
jgi:activating signal cointegrator 1